MLENRSKRLFPPELRSSFMAALTCSSSCKSDDSSSGRSSDTFGCSLAMAATRSWDLGTWSVQPLCWLWKEQRNTRFSGYSQTSVKHLANLVEPTRQTFHRKTCQPSLTTQLCKDCTLLYKPEGSAVKHDCLA